MFMRGKFFVLGFVFLLALSGFVVAESYEDVVVSFDDTEDLYSPYDNSILVGDAPVIKITSVTTNTEPIAVSGVKKTTEAYIFYADTSLNIYPAEYGSVQVYYKDVNYDFSIGNKARYMAEIPLTSEGTLEDVHYLMDIVVEDIDVSVGITVDDGSMDLIFSTPVKDSNSTYISEIKLNIGGDVLSTTSGTLEWLGGHNEPLSRENAEAGDVISDGVDVSQMEYAYTTLSGIIIGGNNVDGVEGNADNDEVFLSIPTGGDVPVEPDTMSVDISKGWNLIYGFVEPEQIINDYDFSEDNIRAIYALMPNMQEYARAWPDPEWDKLNTMDDDEILNSGMWVYSDESGSMEYGLYTDVIPFEQRPIYDGWNFVGITDEMFGADNFVKFGEIVGDCDIMRSYIFDSNDQEWEEMPLDVLVDSYDAVGLTWVINVDGSCILGKDVVSIIPSPPMLPEVDGDLDTDEPLGIAEYVLADIQTDEDCDEFNEGGVSGEVCMVMTNLRYENSDTDSRVYITLIDYTKGFEIFKGIINQYFSGINSEYEYAYDLEGDNAIVWFSDGPYDIVVSERGQGIEANHVTNYFYNKYPAYDAGIDIIERCRDSDGGIDYYTKGETFGKKYSYSTEFDNEADICIGDLITEYFCEGDLRVGQQITCPNGCFDGACIIPDGAYDSDGDVNYEEQGTCVWKGYDDYVQTATDNCGAWYDDVYNPNVLTEWRTGGENDGCWHDQYECPDVCVDGACVESNLTNDCYDSDGGDDIYTEGYREVYNPNYASYGTTEYDYCIQNPDISGSSVISDRDKEVAGCNGEGCYVIELHCVADLSDAHQGYACPNGCVDGVCY